jgi:hypothetical protein
MYVGDVWLRSTLRRAALRYAERGWPVMPGAMLFRERYVCGPLCVTFACHPAVDHWESAASTQTSDVDGWWANGAFSVLLPTGFAFDAIDVPARLGEETVRAIGHGRGPVASAPGGRWLFLVAPGQGLRPELASRLDIVLHGRGSWIAAPPTRTPGGRWRWQVHPSAYRWRLPDPYGVQDRLVTRLELGGGVRRPAA